VHIASIANLLPHIEKAGEMALTAQRNGDSLIRSFKDDQSVVTETDRQLDEFLFERIADLYPGANILTEETVRVFDPHKPYTFVLDPIDGSDVYSQGMPGWCTALGLMDHELQPIAGVVLAPALDLLLFADVGRPATFNGQPLVVQDTPLPLSGRSNLMVSSKIHREVSLGRFPGKIRSMGSAILHLCSPLLYPGVVGAIQARTVRVWDIAAAHAILRSQGYGFEYLGDGEVNYERLVRGSIADDLILSGSPAAIQALRSAFAPHGAA
jgi:myo-inositol-1(or 4)-monophosphatase